MGLYANDGKCHNSQPGTYGHECGKPAAWIGRKANGFESGFCAHCKTHGSEARGYVEWRIVGEPSQTELSEMVRNEMARRAIAGRRR